MLKSINAERFAIAIQQSDRHMTEASAANLAAKLISEVDESLEPAVLAWLDGTPVPDLAVGKYSIGKILQIRNSANYLEAIRLLSEYKQDPAAGEKKIWKPVRSGSLGGAL